jgi:hypothetical protein
LFLLIFTFVLFCVFVSSTIYTNLHCYSRNHNCSFVIICFQYIYWFLSLKIIIGLHCEGYWLRLPKENKLWGKRCSEYIRVKNPDFCVKHERCEDIFCSTNQILQIQRMFENNKLMTQNANVAFQLQAIGQQLEFLSRTYKNIKDEVNSIKQ